MSHKRDIIFHTLLAGWCGDAAGATLEFQKRQFTEIEARHAMRMEGGGSTGVQPGQITDDSELELCLLAALVDGYDLPQFPIDLIASRYIEWFKSTPFDIGNTTQTAFDGATSADDIYDNVACYNNDSASNGSLMRCVPLAIVLMHKPIPLMFELIALEVQLTHSNPVVIECTQIYCLMIATILTHRLDDNGNKITGVQILDAVQPHTNLIKPWLDTARQLTRLDDYGGVLLCVGFVKHAFTLVVFFLEHMADYTYEEAIKVTLMLGGDTDTNAKIVGNIFGAFYGDCVPTYMSTPVLSFDSTTVADECGLNRPAKYCIKHCLPIVDALQIK